GGRGAFLAAKQNQARGSEVERKAKQGGEEQHRRERGKIQRLFDVERNDQDRQRERDARHQRHIKQQRRHRQHHHDQHAGQPGGRQQLGQARRAQGLFRGGHG